VGLVGANTPTSDTRDPYVPQRSKDSRIYCHVPQSGHQTLKSVGKDHT